LFFHSDRVPPAHPQRCPSPEILVASTFETTLTILVKAVSPLSTAPDFPS
jgi:hypothetical protein